MKTRLYSYKTLDLPKLINMLNDEGHTHAGIARAVGVNRATVSSWKSGRYRTTNRALCDKLVDYAMRSLIDSELEECEIYP